MKPRQGSVPNSSDESDGDGRPHYVSDTFESDEIEIGRDRHATVASPVPAVLAESLRPSSRTAALARDPAAPVSNDSPEPTRKVGNGHWQELRQESPPAGNDGLAAHRRRASACIDQVRNALEFARAAVAAEAAMREADQAPPPGIVEVIEPARPLIIRAFATYVGPLGAVAVLASRAPAIARTRLGNAQRAVLARIDGVRSLEEVFDGSGLGLMDTLRTAAALVQTGTIRIV